MRNPWRGLGGLPREIWILVIANLVNRAGMMVLPMLLIYLTRELAFSAARSGFIGVLSAMLFSLSTPKASEIPVVSAAGS